MHNKKTLDRIGETRINTMGSKMWIIKYNNVKDIDVQFEDEYVAENMTYKQFELGKIKNPNDISVFGFGYLGVGRYKAKINYKITQQYKIWRNIMQRCYSNKFQEKNLTYIGCSVDKEWHNFQNFAQWYDENYYEVLGQKMELDKDWIVKNNKIYSPKTCIFVPEYINSLIINNKKNRGKLPLGVTVNNGRYRARCKSNTGESEFLGYHDSIELAFQAYKIYKETHIKKVAEQYKDQIPEKLYNAMYAYEIEIDD